ncbi:MAG: glycosyltransferase family 2 protein [Candidatus Latescibacterota bacterium]
MRAAHPRVAIGLPVFNGEKYLAETLDSLLAQTYEEFDLIISDNASTDRTEEICRDYAAGDERICYYRNDDNRGAAWNYNRVFELAGGEYFKWAAHDDLLAPAYIERCIEVLDRDADVVLCYPKTRIIDENGEAKEDYEDNLHLDSAKPHMRFRHVLFDLTGECNAIFGLIRRETLCPTILIGNFHSSDMVLLAEMAMRGRFSEIAQRLFFRRDHPDTSVRLHHSKHDRTVWFDPQKTGHNPMLMWRWLYEFAKAVKRVPMNASDKSRCYALVGKWARVHHRMLRHELTQKAAARMGRQTD